MAEGRSGFALMSPQPSIFATFSAIASDAVNPGDSIPNKFTNPAKDGVVLPILHLNGYKIANPTVLDRIPQDELRSLMLQRHQRYVPVMEGETLQGVISFHDVAKAVLEEQAFENRMLKGYIKNWPA